MTGSVIITHMKKIIIVIIAIAVIGGAVYMFNNAKVEAPNDQNMMMHEDGSTMPEGSMMDGDDAMNASNGMMMEDGTSPESMMSSVKEFSLDSFMKMEGETRVAGFSVKEIAVKKGDKVRIAINNISGVHDFKIDEFKISADTPEGKTTIVEFTADKVGEFKYYCSKYNHRQIGQEGILKVTE